MALRSPNEPSITSPYNKYKTHNGLPIARNKILWEHENAFMVRVYGGVGMGRFAITKDWE